MSQQIEEFRDINRIVTLNINMVSYQEVSIPDSAWYNLNPRPLIICSLSAPINTHTHGQNHVRTISPSRAVLISSYHGPYRKKVILHLDCYSISHVSAFVFPAPFIRFHYLTPECTPLHPRLPYNLPLHDHVKIVVLHFFFFQITSFFIEPFFFPLFQEPDA